MDHELHGIVAASGHVAMFTVRSVKWASCADGEKQQGYPEGGALMPKAIRGLKEDAESGESRRGAMYCRARQWGAVVRWTARSEVKDTGRYDTQRYEKMRQETRTANELLRCETMMGGGVEQGGEGRRLAKMVERHSARGMELSHQTSRKVKKLTTEAKTETGRRTSKNNLKKGQLSVHHWLAACRFGLCALAVSFYFSWRQSGWTFKLRYVR